MNTPTIDLIVTRHPSLVALMVERGIADEGTRVIEHAKPDDARGRHVLGILPHHLSSQAASITEIPMRLSVEDRKAMQGGELPIERLREVAGRPVTYVVAEAGGYEVAAGRVLGAALMSVGQLGALYMVGSLVHIEGADCQTLAQVDLHAPAWRAGSNLPHVESKPWRDQYRQDIIDG